MAHPLSSQSPQTALAQASARHIWAAGICALALLLGIAVVDDYGVWPDTYLQRAIGEANLRHMAGESGLDLLQPRHDRLYGPIFEVPLRLVERFFFSEAGRELYVARYLATHIFFLVAGFTCYVLVWRMFGSRWLALFALALFLLHPRIYAHSFFNSKDVPFLSMFMICLWLAHRAFRPHSPSSDPALSATVPAGNDAAIYGAPAIYGAFALCGIATGLLTNLRVFGLAFFAIVILMHLCDVVAAGGWHERRRAIASCALFAVASVGTYYATMPYLWADPLKGFMEVVTTLSAHPNDKPRLFQGELVPTSGVPPSYLPVWFGITTPPLALALGAVGFGALIWRYCTVAAVAFGECRARPLATYTAAFRAMRHCLRNAPLRFELLVGACFALPVLAIIVLQPTIYNGWRHLYFLWAPFVLLAASGLRTLAEGVRGTCRRFLPARVPATAVVAGLAALGLGAIAVEVIRMHPDQEWYFNVLATGPHTTLPPQQRYSYHLGVVGAPRGFAYILEELADREEPDAVFNVREAGKGKWDGRAGGPLGIIHHTNNFGLLPERDQRRFRYDPNVDADYFLLRSPHFAGLAPSLTPPVLYERRIYGEPIMQVATPDLSRVHTTIADVYRALYRDVTASVPALSGETDIYRSERAVTWVKESCPAGGVNRPGGMIVVPLDAARAHQRFFVHGVRVNGACLWQGALPEYAIGKILFFDGIGELVSDAYLQELRRRHAAISAGPPAGRSTFDVYVEDGALFYIRPSCVEADTEAPFVVHVWPAHRDDLRNNRRRLGFDALDFRFGGGEPSWRVAAGDIFDGICMATMKLPDYPIAKIVTGQYVPGRGEALWLVDIDLTP